MNKREFLVAASAVLAAPRLQAQVVLPKSIRIVVGFPAGGGTDVLARLLAQRLAPVWNSAVIVDNRAGAAGAIAAEQVARAPADGSTLLMAHINSHALAPAFNPKLRYDADKDFSPIVLIGATPQVLMCASTQAVNTLDKVIDLCRRQPGKITFGSAGSGSAQHLALELFKQRTGIDVLHVPYRGSAPLMIDLLGGQIQYCFEGMTTATTQAKSGGVTLIAQTRRRRSRSLPNVGTMEEGGFAGFDAGIWFGLVGPASMSADLSLRMNADVNTVLKIPEVIERLEQFGAADGGGSREAFGAFMKDERMKWGQLIQAANIKLDS